MGIAIVLVILHHFCLRLDGCWHVDTFPFTIFYWGQIGVDIFLFVSAYGCCASWENNSCWQYALHRIKRIYPQYIVFLLIVLLWFFADASILHRMKMAVFSLIGIAPIYRLGVSIEWYIPSLLMMYFFLPFLFFFWPHQLSSASGSCVLLFSQLRIFEGSHPLYWWVRPQRVKNLPAIAGDPGSIPGSGRSLEKGMATHSSILARRNTEEPNGLSSPWGHKE